jgi:N-methylhydantoinase B/oxoprolinase/acetone carboxylase alpha subunit
VHRQPNDVFVIRTPGGGGWGAAAGEAIRTALAQVETA